MRAAREWALKTCLIAVTALLVIPAAAYAQASIAGVVRDASGAVLPGVTVEAASPALIEKTRTGVTDGGGQYRITDLRPGAYTVTFTLTGFTTVRRDGITLSGDFVASVDVELRVGSVEETITVTGAAPIVETRATRQQVVLDKDVLAAIPSGRSHYHIATLIPGMQTGVQDVGGSAGIQVTGAGSIHGATSGRLLSDGMSVGHNGESLNMWVSNVGGAAETVVSTSGGLGEAETGGVVINVIPREGGNRTSGQVFYAGANSSMQGSNYTDELKARGLRAPNEIDLVYDFNPAFGGKIIQDKLWYFLTHRNVGAYNSVAGMFYNKNAGNPSSWTYEPTSRQAIDGNHYSTGSIRLTYQANAKNKFNVFWDEQHRCVQCNDNGGTATQSPEASARSDAMPTRVYQATWQSPATNRILLEAGYSAYMQRWGNRPRNDGTQNLSIVSTTEQAGIIPGLTYRQPGTYGHNWTGIQNWRGAFSYITGAHSVKIGYLGGNQAPIQNEYTGAAGISNYRFLNGVPNQFTLYTNRSYQGISRPLGIYAQDQWVLGRVTLQGAIRYDHMSVDFKGGDQVPDNLDVPTIHANAYLPQPIRITDPEQLKGQRYSDITPRMGVAYDVFGNGKSAVKVTLGKFMETVVSVTGGANGNALTPVARLAVTTNRSWNDANGNYVPDCELLNPNANGECGAMSDRRFGTAIPSQNPDRDAFEGWGKRAYNWEFGANYQQELMTGVSVNVGFFRRWFGNFLATDNRAVTPADYDRYSITAPVDPRLPGGGGYVISDLLDVNPAKFGQVDSVVTLAKNYGDMERNWQGVDFTGTVRKSRATFQGGVSIGREHRDECAIRAALPEAAPSWSTNTPWGTVPFCSWSTPYQPNVKGLGSYTIPKVEVQVSATLQSIPGVLPNQQTSVAPVGLAANFNAPNALIAPSLGRPLAGGAANVGINLLKPGEMYGERTNQIDFRVVKILSWGRTRTQVGLDLYNLTNSNAIQNYNQTYGPAWLTPTSILTARFAKISAQVNF